MTRGSLLIADFFTKGEKQVLIILKFFAINATSKLC